MNFVIAKRQDTNDENSGLITFNLILSFIGLMIFAYVLYKLQYEDLLSSARCY
jgi:hypothetical protein